MSKPIPGSSLHKAVEMAQRQLDSCGTHGFQAAEWRSALLHHVHRMMDGMFARPILHLGGVTLEWDAAKDEYFAYGTPPFAAAPQSAIGLAALSVDPPSGAAVQMALGKLAMRQDVRTLVIYFRSAMVELWKTPGTEFLGVAAAGIPAKRIVAPTSPTVGQDRLLVPPDAGKATGRRTSSSGRFRTV